MWAFDPCQYRRHVPGSRLPLRVIVLSTVLVFAAAAITYVVLSPDDGDDGSASDGTIELTPSDGPAGDPDEVAFTTFEDDTVTLASLQGRPVVVNFFASTCTPCIKEMPAFEEVFQELGDEVSFLGLAVQDRPDAAVALVERTGISYPTAQDPDGDVINALGGTILPTTVLLDAEGEIVTTHNGALEADELRQLLADELGVGA